MGITEMGVDEMAGDEVESIQKMGLNPEIAHSV